MKLKILLSKLNTLVIEKPWVFFVIILIIGLYLRFNHIGEVIAFNWDQGRDAWEIRNIIQGKLTLIGPKTGIGEFHLGPIYYYLLVPFYYAANLDPMASNYFNILANIVNFIIIFAVTKKIFNNYAALFVTLLYATSTYLTVINRIPWNVTLMPGVAALIFFSIINVYREKYRWVFAAWILSGFYFNLHFTAIFLPLIVGTSFIFVKKKKLVIKYSLLSLPLYFIWFIPNILYELQNSNTDYYRMRDFLQNYYIGFHLRFMLHRLPDSLLEFGAIINYPPLSLLKYLVPAVFFILAFFFGKKKEDRILAYLISLWFIIPLFGFTIYGGPISDYYFLYGAPMVLFVLWFLAERLFLLKRRLLYILSILFLCLFIHHNIKDTLKRPAQGGLNAQKESVKKTIINNEKIDYSEGDIRSYLYTIWEKDGARF